MNLQLKNTLIIIATLFLGIIIGFLVNGRLSQIRIDNMRQNYAQKGMDYRFLRALNPTDKQMKVIRPIFDKYNNIRMENLEEHWKTEREIFDNFEEELKPHLTTEQINRLSRIKQKFNNKPPGFENHNRGKGRKQRRGNRN
ncbi:MAG: hypothetical protein C0595_14085 [Marinilabiliales bacterium]|nr:MAG: hypothetical protein C0595_14085 [Marinilabiliales bacterium]